MRHRLLTLCLLLSAVRAAAATPLPPVEFVLQQVAAASTNEPANDRQFLAHYRFERTKVQEERNRLGLVLKRSEKKITYQPPTNTPVALAPASLGADGHETRTLNTTNYQGRAFERRDFALNADLLSRFSFTLIGRETVEGRPALVLDFVPAARQPHEHNLKDRFMNQAAGRVWVDEADWYVRRVALHLAHEVDVVGGLVGAVRAFTYNFDRGRTPEGWWFTRTVDWHLEGRAVLTRRVIDYHESRTNVVNATGPSEAAGK